MFPRRVRERGFWRTYAYSRFGRLYAHMKELLKMEIKVLPPRHAEVFVPMFRLRRRTTHGTTPWPFTGPSCSMCSEYLGGDERWEVCGWLGYVVCMCTFKLIVLVLWITMYYKCIHGTFKSLTGMRHHNLLRDAGAGPCSSAKAIE